MLAPWLLIGYAAILTFDGLAKHRFARAYTNVVKDDTLSEYSGFKFYWNVPTFMCRQYGMYFEDVVSKFGIIQNQKDQFKGEHITILYDPGVFPAILKTGNGQLVTRNGGIPQEGNLSAHLEKFSKDIKKSIPDEKFSGIGVIDFESWRPIFRQNWASLNPYREMSVALERQRHPWWNKSAIQRKAVENFEKYGRLFMEESLKTAKNLRPLANWGYYAYPYCYNLTPNQPGTNCDPKVFDENDRLKWLFGAEDVILPSVYLRQELSRDNKIGLIKGRVKEARRVSKRVESRPGVFAYFWYKYQDNKDVYLSMNDMRDGFKSVYDNGANGVILWGSSNDVNNRVKCQKLMNYVNDILGPEVVRLRDVYSSFAGGFEELLRYFKF